MNEGKRRKGITIPDFGRRRLQKYRILNGLTQEKLAELVDCSTHAIQNMESPNYGKPIGEKLLFKVAEILKMEPAQIIQRHYRGTRQADRATPQQSPQSTERFSSVLAEKGLYDTLEKLYPDHQLFKFNGKKYAITVFPAAESQLENIESPRSSLVSTTVPGPDEYPSEFDQCGRAHFVDLREKEASRPDDYWNGPTYDLVEINQTKNGPKLSFRMGRYFLALSTSDNLIEQELIDRLALDPNRVLDLDDLPRRKWLHDELSRCGRDPVCCGDFRSAAAGINTLIVFRDEDDGQFYFFGHPRSDKVATYSYFFNVVPSGMFQPTVRLTKPSCEFSVRHNFLREYFEELYDGKAVKKGEGHSDHKYFYEQGPVKRLLDRLSTSNPKRRAELYFTGVCVNLLTLRPDICTLLLIRDGGWHRKEGSPMPNQKGGIFSIKFNEEYLRGDPPHLKVLFDKLGIHKLKTRVELNDELEIVRPDELGPHNMLPPAAAFIGLGLAVAKRKLGIE